jgi:hypothetical protein
MLARPLRARPTRSTPRLVFNKVRFAQRFGKESISLRNAPRSTTSGGCGTDRCVVGVSTIRTESFTLSASINEDSLVSACNESIGSTDRPKPIA